MRINNLLRLPFSNTLFTKVHSKSWGFYCHSNFLSRLLIGTLATCHFLSMTSRRDQVQQSDSFIFSKAFRMSRKRKKLYSFLLDVWMWSSSSYKTTVPFDFPVWRHIFLCLLFPPNKGNMDVKYECSATVQTLVLSFPKAVELASVKYKFTVTSIIYNL